MKHGIYRQHLNEQERALFDSAELGTLEHELRLARVRLDRAVQAEASGEYEDTDFHKITNELLARIGHLELSRLKLRGDDPDDGESLHDPDPDV